jgi:hypothetical protein
MNNTYTGLVQQTFHFPQEGFNVKDDYLQFNGVDLKALIDKHGTPPMLLKSTTIPGNTIIAIVPKAAISLLL